MNFRDRIRSVAGSPTRGIEIGPSYRPILPKSAGFNTVILDHASADELREKYAKRENISLIEEVDIVWHSGALEDQFCGQKFDWIVASHVIEHVPDIIGFLKSCEKLLKDDGKVYLAIPDKRRTFDFVKPHLEVGTALQRHREQRGRHDFATVFAAFNDHVLVDGRGDWGTLPINEIQLAANPLAALDVATQATGSDDYFDCHANYLTPASFTLLLLELRMLKMTRLLGPIHQTAGCEFFAELGLLPEDEVEITLRDYRTAKTRVRLAVFKELDDQIQRLKQSATWARQLQQA